MVNRGEKRGGWRRREEQIHHSCKYISEPEEAKQTGRVSGVKGQQVGRCISVHVETGLQFSLNNLYNEWAESNVLIYFNVTPQTGEQLEQQRLRI